jgi:hypothetical protein
MTFQDVLLSVPLLGREIDSYNEILTSDVVEAYKEYLDDVQRFVYSSQTVYIEICIAQELDEDGLPGDPADMEFSGYDVTIWGPQRDGNARMAANRTHNLYKKFDYNTGGLIDLLFFCNKWASKLNRHIYTWNVYDDYFIAYTRADMTSIGGSLREVVTGNSCQRVVKILGEPLNPKPILSSVIGLDEQDLKKVCAKMDETDYFYSTSKFHVTIYHLQGYGPVNMFGVFFSGPEVAGERLIKDKYKACFVETYEPEPLESRRFLLEYANEIATRFINDEICQCGLALGRPRRFGTKTEMLCGKCLMIRLFKRKVFNANS